MADDKHSKKSNSIDSPSNRSLSTLIDQDLQKESELLQNLIEEVVEANEKVKASHQRRLEDSQEKIRIMNQEIKRLREAINRKDEETTKAQFDQLLSSKDMIHESLRSMRMHPIDNLLNEAHERSAEALKDRLIQHLEHTATPTEEDHHFMRRFKEASQTFIEHAYEQGLNATGKDDASGLEDTVKAFKASMDTFLESLKATTDDIAASFTHRAHILSDGSLDTSLKERVESTYKEKKHALDKERAALETDKQKALETIDNALDEKHEALASSTRESFKDALEKERQNQESLDEDLKTLKLDIIRAEKQGDTDTLKDLLKTYHKKTTQSEDLVQHKVNRIIEKKFAPYKIKRLKEKRAIEKTYARKHAAIDVRRAQLDVQFSGSDELFKVQDDLDAFKQDQSYNETFTNALMSIGKTYEALLEGVVSFTHSMHAFMIESRIAYLKEASAMTRALGDVEKAFKESQIDLALAYRLKAFEEEKLGIRIKSTLRAQAITMHYHQHVLNAEKALNDIIKQADIEKTYQQETAQNEKIYQQGLIDLADKEYELQLIKVRSLYDNEIALTRAQAERLNVGHGVNEAMVSTTLESQMHFARQQIKYAENEYQVRLENIENALKKELEYAEEKLSSAKQAYRSDIHELENERDRKLQDLAYRQALFTDAKDKRKLDEQEHTIRENYTQRIAKIKAAEKADDTVQRYQQQIDNAKARSEKAKEDAQNLKEKTISTFRTLLEQSEQKLNQFKTNASNEEKLGPYIESEASKTAETRLNEAIEEANKLYKEKIRKPQKRIESLNETIHSIEFDNATQQAIDAHKEGLKALRKTRDTALEKERAQTDMTLKGITEKASTQAQKAQTLKSGLSTKDRSKTASRFDQSIQKVEKTLKRDTATSVDFFKTDFEKRIKTHNQAMHSRKRTLDESLNSTIKAYETFLKKASASQQKALKKAKRHVNAQLKETLKTIDNTYNQKL